VLGETRGTAAISVEYHLRYQGQSFELPIPGPDDPDVSRLIEAFGAAHEERYGYRDLEGEVELVTIRVTLREPGPELDLRMDGGARSGSEEPDAGPGTSRRDAVFHGQSLPTRVFAGPPAPGQALEGPAVVALPEATLVVAPGWRGQADEAGTVILERA
jgi:N-methylhydantoinase A/oxoprolinase/acetone carboxylase beta subunit